VRLESGVRKIARKKGRSRSGDGLVRCELKKHGFFKGSYTDIGSRGGDEGREPELTIRTG